MFFWPAHQGMDFQEALLRMSFSRSTAVSSEGWEAVRQELARYIGRTKLLDSAPELFRECWNERYAVADAPSLRINPNRVQSGRYPEACATIEIEFTTADADVMATSRFLVHGAKVELLETSPGFILPFNVNAPVLQGDRLVLAGMGSLGAMRESPVLQMYEREGARWRLAQTVIRERFAGNAYWGLRGSRLDPDHFVMEVPTDSELTRGQHPAADRTITIEHWVYRAGRYVLAKSHVWDTALHAAERFTTALMHGRRREYLRYATTPITRQAALAGLTNSPSPFSLSWMSSTVVDFSRSWEEPPVRLLLRRLKNGWRIVKVIPRCTADNTWFAWGNAYESARKAGLKEPSYPISRPYAANDRRRHGF